MVRKRSKEWKGSKKRQYELKGGSRWGGRRRKCRERNGRRKRTKVEGIIIKRGKMLGKKFNTCGGGVKGEARRGGRGGNRRRQMEEEKWERRRGDTL